MISAVVLPALIWSRISIQVSSSIQRLSMASMGRGSAISRARSAARAASCSGVSCGR
jgi:hypothetical protein